mgnify:CR=1 FL=1|tara:strand:- start:7 stop:576 length:570 start_codon:yes stop_codon:yes gene_type:complete
MGLSSNINISASVEESYTLSELMELLGSSKKLKDSLLELEAAAVKTDKSLKALAKAEDVRKASVLADTVAKREMQAECVIRVAKAEQAEAKLTTSKNIKKIELAQASEEARSQQILCEQAQSNLAEREAVIKQAETNALSERKREVAEREAAKKEIAKDVKAAEKYRQQALTIKREADDKVAAMKKLIE